MADKRLLPPGLSDDRSMAVLEMAERIGTIDLTSIKMFDINNVPSSVLPHLIEEMHVTGYEGGRLVASDEERRNLILGAIAVHRKKGTPYAVVRALESLGLTAQISEWFNYDGLPYHFKVSIDVDEQEFSAETSFLMDKFINEYKNVRSVLDGVDINLAARGSVYEAVSVQSSEIVTLHP